MANGDQQQRSAGNENPIERTLSCHKGMDTYNEPWFSDPQSAQLIQDMESYRPGKRQRKRGMQSVGAISSVTDAHIFGGLSYIYDDTLRQEVLAEILDGRLYYLPGDQSIIDAASGASFTRLNHSFQAGRWRGLNSLFITSVGYNETDQSLCSDLFVIDMNRDWTQTSSLAPRVGTWWQGRFWAAGNVYSQYADTLWWSELLDGISYCSINTLNIETGRGGLRITGLEPVRADSPKLVIFKERLIAMLSAYWGSSSSLIPAAADALDTIKSQIVVLTDQYGCVAPNSLQSIEGSEAGDMMFLAHDGFRTLKRAADDTVAGANLPLSTQNQDIIGRINFDAVDKAVSTIWDLKYWCAVPLDSATENTHVIMYDLLQGGWHLFTTPLGGLTATRGNLDQTYMYGLVNQPTSDTTYTTPQEGYHAYQMFKGYTDYNQRPPPWIEHSRAYTFGTLDQKKRWQWLGVQFLNNTYTAAFDVLYRLDNGDWHHLANAVAAPIGGWTTVLKQDKLEWTKRPARARLIKFSLQDIEPAYTIQFAVGQTGASDYATVQLLQTMLQAEVLEPEFDNSIA
jgi:hypothetical protein